MIAEVGADDLSDGGANQGAPLSADGRAPPSVELRVGLSNLHQCEFSYEPENTCNKH